MKTKLTNMDKRGISLIPVLAFIFLAFFIVLFMGIGLYGLGLFDSAMSGLDLVIGSQNFTEVYQDTTQQGVNAVFAIADVASLIVIFGMVIIMMLIGYFWGDETKRLWAIFDIFVIIIAFVIAVYLQVYFNDFINSQVLGSSTVFSDDIPKSSRVLLTLPYLVPIVGILIMIVTYGLNKKKENQTYSDIGY